MKDYKSFIIEAQKKALKTVVMAFGRMNPPTVGHQKLVNRVKQLADQHNAHHEVIVSHSQDAQKNPLTQEQKIKHAKRYFPDTNIVASSKEHPNFLEHAKRLHQAGHRHLIMVAGQDRVKEFHDTLKRYNGTHEGALFNFKKISVVSAGARDPDSEGVEGMSASKMREHAKNNNFDEFRKGVPKHVHDEHARELFNDTRKGMGLHEEMDEACWDGYKAVGLKKKGKRMVPNCVPEENKLDTKFVSGIDETMIKVGTLIENDLGEIGKVLSLRENSIVYNVLATGMMKSSQYGDFSLVEAVGHLATNAPDYFFGGVADAPKDKQEQAGHSKRSAQDKDLKGKKNTTPGKYYAGLEKSTKEKRYSHFRTQSAKDPSDSSAYEPAPGDAGAKTKPSKHTLKYKQMYGEEQINNSQIENLLRNEPMNEEAAKGLAAKAAKSGISIGTLRKVYNRGMAAWRTGHRPGTTPQQWGMARVNSYITKGKGTYYGADSDLSGQGKKKKQKNENVSTDYVGHAGYVPHIDDFDKVPVHNENIDKQFETFLNENVHALDTNIESNLLGTDTARITAQKMTPGEPGYTEVNKVKSKKDKKEDYAGADYNSRLSGAPAAVGGIGGAYSISVQEEKLPKNDSIRAWALKEFTQKNFIERYGDAAEEKLIEAAHRMVNAKTSFYSFRQKLEESEDLSETRPFNLSIGGPELGQPPTGYAKQAFGEDKKKVKMQKVNEDEVTFHCEEDELIETLQWDEETNPIDEAEYQGRKVPLGKPMPGDVKKSKVYVKGPSGRIVKVNFGDPNMTIKKNIPARRKSFRARHRCDVDPGPRWKARYWSCKAW